MKYLDYKVEIWNRITLDDNVDVEKLKGAIRNGATPMEIFDDYGLSQDPPIEPLLETEQHIHVNENDGQATMEIIKEDRQSFESLWDNSYESEINEKRKTNDTN